jgi:septum formation protein
MSALILASGSSIRRKMLEDAGVEFEVLPADIDEEAHKEGLTDPATIATTLAEEKAVSVSETNGDAWVIGSDSVVSVDGRLFNKPRSREEAAEHLRSFSGKKLSLVSAAALARHGTTDWSLAGQAELQVRVLTEDFIQAYLDVEWPEVANTVGVFRIEGPGIQLFDAISGGHFTILGMPLLPLLRQLRIRNLLPS